MTRPDDSRTLQIEQYLLGSLSEEETSRLDRRLLEEPELFSAVEAAEDELIDRYVRAELPPDDHRRFEERLLSFGRIRRRVGFARALRDLADDRGGRQQTGGGLVRLADRRQNDVGGTSSGPFSVRLAWAACLVALLGAGLLSLVNLRLQDRLHGLEEARQAAVERAQTTEQRSQELEASAERARREAEEARRLREDLEAQDEQIADLERQIDTVEQPSTEPAPAEPSGNGERPASYLFFALTTRSDGGTQTLELPLDGPLEVQLGLDRLQPRGDLVVTIRRNGDPVWRQAGLETVYSGPDAMVSVVLPDEMLFPGSYEIDVSEQTSSGAKPLARHELVVE